MVIHTVIDLILRNQRRNNHCGDAWPILIESELILVVSGRGIIEWSGGATRMHMIIKSSVLIPSDDQDARRPNGRVPNDFVCILDQGLALHHIAQRVLGRAVSVFIENVVTWLDEDVAIRVVRFLQIAGKETV